MPQSNDSQSNNNQSMLDGMLPLTSPYYCFDKEQVLFLSHLPNVINVGSD